MAKFIDNARHLPSLDIEAYGAIIPISVTNNTGTAISAITDGGTAVEGRSTDGYAIAGGTANGWALLGDSSGGHGTGGLSIDGTSAYGYSLNGTGVVGGTSNASGNWAGDFQGNVNVTGTCCNSGAGTYKIDDPLDPQSKYLYHSAVESPDMMNVYNGNVTTDAKGEAIVTLPPYFEALNRDYRYQLTVIGQFAQAIVSEKVKDNRFSIKTNKPSVEVSWQITGIRQDPYAKAHRIPEEQDKPADEKGKYLHPTEWGQPASLGVNYEAQQQAQQMLEQDIQSKP